MCWMVPFRIFYNFFFLCISIWVCNVRLSCAHGYINRKLFILKEVVSVLLLKESGKILIYQYSSCGTICGIYIVEGFLFPFVFRCSFFCFFEETRGSFLTIKLILRKKGKYVSNITITFVKVRIKKKIGKFLFSFFLGKPKKSLEKKVKEKERKKENFDYIFLNN